MLASYRRRAVKQIHHSLTALRDRTRLYFMSTTSAVVAVDVIVPVYNAAATLRETLHSALHQVSLPPNHERDRTSQKSIEVCVCCYDDGSTDNSWDLLNEIAQEHEQETKKRADITTTTEDDKPEESYLPTSILIARPQDGISRGAGFARNRAVDLRKQGRDDVSTAHRFLAMLDSDDLMHPTRIAAQVQFLMLQEPNVRERTLLGCTFERDPPDSTWHYANWANTLTDERLVLEQFREVTLVQPTWMIARSWFEKLGGYLEAPPPNQTHFNIADFVPNDDNEALVQVVHTGFETAESLRVAEDTRFFYRHRHAGGHLRLLRTETPLLIYKHREGQSQSSQTPRKLLVHLRARALERMILHKEEWSKFCVWGAGRDGKDFIKALQPEFREHVACIVDVDQKKIDVGRYYNKDLGVSVPIVHFSLLARDLDVRQRLGESYEVGTDGNEAGFGRIQKNQDTEAASPAPAPPRKRRKVSRVKDFDGSVLPTLPVVVCVAMYRTGGALEHNVRSIGRTEGIDLWHFS